MSTVTKAQLSKIHVLLSQLQLSDEKANFVNQFSNGRTSSSKELTMNEARNMLTYLSGYDPGERMRKKVIALAYEAEIIEGNSTDDKKINNYLLGKFLLERGAIKKPLNSMNKAELIKTVNQFELIITHNKKAKNWKLTKSVLNDMNIKTSR